MRLWIVMVLEEYDNQLVIDSIWSTEIAAKIRVSNFQADHVSVVLIEACKLTLL